MNGQTFWPVLFSAIVAIVSCSRCGRCVRLESQPSYLSLIRIRRWYYETASTDRLLERKHTYAEKERFVMIHRTNPGRIMPRIIDIHHAYYNDLERHLAQRDYAKEWE